MGQPLSQRDRDMDRMRSAMETLSAINEGQVYRYVIKPWDPSDMNLAIRQALEWKDLRASQGQLNAEIATANRALAQRNRDLEEAQATILRQQKLAAVDRDPRLSKLAAEHEDIGAAVLAETAKLHAGDEENLRLWREFLPACEEEINRVYQRLDVRFDVWFDVRLDGCFGGRGYGFGEHGVEFVVARPTVVV